MQDLLFFMKTLDLAFQTLHTMDHTAKGFQRLGGIFLARYRIVRNNL